MSKADAIRRTVRTIMVAGFLSLGAVICAAQKPTAGTAAGGQTGTHQSGSTTPASTGTPSLLDSLPPSPFPDTSKQKRNDERQRRIVSDTQKLLALTSQLKAEVAASGADAMTPEMLRQMDEIEKLAKSVKDKMRD